jgi:hypothetical protein
MDALDTKSPARDGELCNSGPRLSAELFREETMNGGRRTENSKEIRAWFSLPRSLSPLEVPRAFSPANRDLDQHRLDDRFGSHFFWDHARAA